MSIVNIQKQEHPEKKRHLIDVTALQAGVPRESHMYHFPYPFFPATTPNAGPPFPNIFLKSPTRSSGRSYAAKCPPLA